MEKRFKLLLLLLTMSSVAFAQKIGYVDSEYILNRHPDYKKVQEEMEALASEWRKEAQNLETEIKEMYNALKAEEVLLTEEMYQERLQAIKEKEKSATAFNNRVFGRSEEHTSELQSRENLVCRLLLEKKKKNK